ncbi:MAG: malate synthase [Pseudohongiellaceae bacterium]
MLYLVVCGFFALIHFIYAPLLVAFIRLVISMINSQFKNFIDQEVLPKTQLSVNKFWQDFSALINEFSPRNKELLEHRLHLQKQIDEWHLNNKSLPIDTAAYSTFLKDIGYLVSEGKSFKIETENVDSEIATIAGPQLVVPLKNARFALNAANARWGSLYDALYGSDVIPETNSLKAGADYNPLRGNEVIAYGRKLLDESVPLASGSHGDVVSYQIHQQTLLVTLADNSQTNLSDSSHLVAFSGKEESPTAVLLKHNGLHIELLVNHEGAIGKTDRAGVDDIVLEAAITTIMDCEDSVAAVDSDDKVEVYRNWLGLMCGTLSIEFSKNGEIISRRLNPDKNYNAIKGGDYQVSGRSLLFNRNVGLLMDSDMITDVNDQPVPEHMIDGVLTALVSMIDLNHTKSGNKNTSYGNSKAGSIYIVKPKMHGPAEVGFVCELFGAIEKMLGLPANTIKLGIMDEERRTTVNLMECIRVAKHRLVFINTGFLDRTGDEIHTSMEAGSFLAKEQIKQQPWIKAYENRNVDIGLDCGLSGKAQIGKGMWPMPDEMAQMMKTKIQHPLAGANTAWVPSPTAAVLHATHYHQVNVFEVQKQLVSRPMSSLSDVLTIPLLPDRDSLSKTQIEGELRNNIQGILGYVVRWVEAGVGCSKVPDINNVGLMEDRATLRISAKHVANWLHHGLCNKQQVIDIMIEMAAIVDEQNQTSQDYSPMSRNVESSMGFQAAKTLIFESQSLPSGYTEPVLHEYRRQQKLKASAAAWG